MKFVVDTECGSPNEYGVRRKDKVKLASLARWCKQYKRGYVMRMTRPVVGAAFLMLFSMAIPAHAGVYKWVDENGLAHYTDQPPKKGEHSQLHIQAAPIQAAPGNGSRDTPSPKQAEQQRLNEISAKLQAARDLAAAQEKVKAGQRRYDEQKAEEKKSFDDKLIADCKRNHEVYCDKGVEKIKSELEWQNTKW